MTEQIYKIVESVIISRALYVCCDLNIADLLAVNPMNINCLSASTKCNKDALARLMRVLSLEGLFQLIDGKYHNTDLGELLCENHNKSIRPFLLHDDETRWNSLGHLGFSIKTGKPAFDDLYRQDYFKYLEGDKKLSDRFNTAMHVISSNEDQVIAKEINFNGVVADIGGGTGQLLNYIKESNNISSGILFDLPEVEPKFIYGNCQKISGSFFEPLNINADIYVLKRILHDWDDEKSISILRNIVNTMPSESRLFIFEGIIDDTVESKFLAAIDLLLLSVFGGKERTMHEFDILLRSAGLYLVSTKKLTATMNMIECRKTKVSDIISKNN